NRGRAALRRAAGPLGPLHRSGPRRLGVSARGDHRSACRPASRCNRGRRAVSPAPSSRAVRRSGALLLMPYLARASAGEPAPQPPPSDAQCTPLPEVQLRTPFRPGESLEYALDALGAQAGKLLLRVLPLRDGALPLEARAETNAFFSKIRRVHGKATSYVDPA